jgi:hypothetical protein
MKTLYQRMIKYARNHKPLKKDKPECAISAGNARDQIRGLDDECDGGCRYERWHECSLLCERQGDGQRHLKDCTCNKKTQGNMVEYQEKTHRLPKHKCRDRRAGASEHKHTP